MSACADWLQGRYRMCVLQLVATCVWFRCDMVLLLGTIGITLLVTRKVHSPAPPPRPAPARHHQDAPHTLPHAHSRLQANLSVSWRGICACDGVQMTFLEAVAVGLSCVAVTVGACRGARAPTRPVWGAWRD